MRSILAVLSFVLMTTVAADVTQAARGERDDAPGRPQFVAHMVRPQIVFHPLTQAESSEFVTVRGVVFSRAPIDRVTVSGRQATIRPAEAEEVISIGRTPKAASEAPVRTYFELPDAALGRAGAIDLHVIALTIDGRTSNTHRLTVLRPVLPAAEQN